MDPETMLDLLTRINDADAPPTDDELVQLAAAITDVAGTIDVTNPSDDDIATLTEARDHLIAIRTVQEQRSQVVAERSTVAAELMSGIAPPDPATEPEPVEEVSEPVAASTVPQLPSIAHLARRRPASRRPIVASTESAFRRNRKVMTAGGSPVEDGDLVEAVKWALEREYGERQVPSNGSRARMRMLTVEPEWPEERILSRNEWDNDDKIDAVCGDEALVASGGICAPANVDYSVANISRADRPVLNGLPSFMASHGGIRFTKPYSLAGIGTSAITTWTAANDVTLNSPATKSTATLTCGTVQEVLVSAIVEQVKMGNFAMKFSPEIVQQYLAVTDAAWARTADATLLQTMIAGSTSVNSGSNLTGAASEFLAGIDRAAAGQRYRSRMGPDTPLSLFYPAWLHDMFRADSARELPITDNAQLSVTDADIKTWFAARNIDATAVWDSPVGTTPIQGFGAQAGGDLLNWPSKVQALLFPTGTWLAVSGGTLDLGVIRDVSTNATNDLVMFKEVFETVALRGVESMAILFDVVPSGAKAATVDTTALATSGS